jgi:hypothetical protein
MQSVQLIALVTRQFETALPVLVRLMGSDVEFLTLDPENPSDPTDHDNWEVMEKCTPEDMEELQEVVTALGGDPAVVMAQFPNCDHY